MNYAVNPGPRGNPRQWREAFRDRLGLDEARAAVGADSPEEILGVAVGSAWIEVQRAYRKLALKHHPDVGGNAAAFRRIQGAYEVLEARKR